MRKPTKCRVYPMKTQISLRLRRIAGDRTFISVTGIHGINPRELTNQNSSLICKFSDFIPFKIAELLL